MQAYELVSRFLDKNHFSAVPFMNEGAKPI